MYVKIAITSVCLLAINLFCFSQERFGGSEKGLKKLKESGLQVSTGDISSTMDEALQNAFEKYFTFCPVEFVSSQSIDKDKPALQLANYKIKSWTHYSFTKLTINNTLWLNYSCHLDNLTVKNDCIGIDKTEDDIASRLNLIVLNLNAQMKFLYDAYAENKKGINSWNGYKERLKGTTILIPSEYLQNGLTKAAFKGIPKKEFIPMKDIDKRLTEGKGKGYAALIAYQSVVGAFFNVLDLETGDFLFRRDFGMAFAKGHSGGVPKVTDKDVIKSIEEMYEK